MAYPALIIGKSGAGKSSSMMTLNPAKVALIQTIPKPLPFKAKFDKLVTDDVQKIMNAISKTTREIIVIDDAGYIMTNLFMKNHSNAGAGNGVFTLYNRIGDSFWNLINFCINLPSDKRVYIMMHQDQDDFGNIKPKSIGKMIDEKVCLEGMFAICLRAAFADGKHIFFTQSDGMDTAKSPFGMFPDTIIPNDLKMVDDAICDYYEIKKEGNE